MNGLTPKRSMLNYKRKNELPEKKFSVKKTLAGTGAVVIFVISAYTIYKQPEQIGNVLWPLMSLVVLLFGIKTAGGVMINKQNGVKK